MVKGISVPIVRFSSLSVGDKFILMADAPFEPRHIKISEDSCIDEPIEPQRDVVSPDAMVIIR